ncbi:MAG TPA: 4a-hydroxytetrahydrobiopterin dehydratase [Thermoanaerobaculia bacterium]|jgi:4a-hydroxytetrahydrobiopterin dehydratase|nr:4a-hydroxytetrahydrobiopterin dehydratase [Thermoanaerobaculia bacterium]
MNENESLPPGWRIVEAHHLEKEYTFPNFAEALAFVNRVGAIAEEMDHHPDVYLAWGKVRIQTWTHVANGLTQKDFVLADRIELRL